LNYEDCFKQGLLRYVEPSKKKSEESIKQAEEWFNEAMINFKAGANRSALSSVYLSIFHAARAILFIDGVREKSHYCVGMYLEKYVEQGLLEKNWVMIFDRMRSIRHADQYSFYTTHTTEEIQSYINTAKEFVERMKKLLKSCIGSKLKNTK
jgi:uncharacterized protein (UPF0332 family)